MRALFEGENAVGMVAGALTSNSLLENFSKEYSSAQKYFSHIAQKIQLSSGEMNVNNAGDIASALATLGETEKKGEMIKNNLVFLAGKINYLFQIAYHNEDHQNEAKFIPKALALAIKKSWHILRNISSGLGIDFDEMIMFETRSTSRHEEPGFGCTHPLLQSFFDNLKAKGLLGSPVVSDILRVGFISRLPEIPSEKSIIRVYYK